MDLVVLENWLDNSAFAVLFLTMIAYWVGAVFPNIPYLQGLSTAGIAIANLSIASLLGARWLEGGYFPLSNLYESLFFLVWGITAVHLLAEFNTRSRLVGVFTAPVGMMITAFATLSLPQEMQVSEPLVPALKSNWLMMHVSVMMLSYAALMVGSLLAIAFLVVTKGENIQLQGSSFGAGGFRRNGYQLRKAGEVVLEDLGLNAENNGNGLASYQSNGNGNASTAVLNLVETSVISGNTTILDNPKLSPQRLSLAETLDNISYRIIGLGFPLLTIGIIAGAVWANEAWGSYWSWDPKETWALITWLVFAAYLHARITRGWQGRRPAILAATGFVVVWVCYLGVNLLGKGLHSYGWFL
ncbi:c-type cytochrome biogenesis protein CcsB [Calothrix sp. NIES-3974]|uniref:c-type cytochrome biogenesis protein CcsB n=1 Tax=Calothrix sp. NIES-3974 TaxID=2005462 RepID=UPI000B5EC32E|nr:c-type cytochrome biogenesis protein CcsB [Calothrix sp. NIES-3974]BAZ05753.1 cytochrome c assembly protein [Calothrix sp. NIES-3974]